MITEHLTAQFKQDGYTVIPNFLSSSEVQELKEATNDVVAKYCKEMPTSVFSAKSDENFGNDENRDSYFATSGDKIRGFFEEDAVDPDGKIVIAEGGNALNKIGHALHQLDPVFEKFTFSEKMKKVVTEFTFMKTPTVCQSMVIFKNPKIGGEVKPHQDATYLYTEPTAGSLLGLWIALDDATLENGCLHFIPGSHKMEAPFQRFIRNPDEKSDKLFVLTGDKVIAPQEDFVAVPVKAGDLVLIDGLVVHQSESNKSTSARWAYTFHIFDGSSSFSKQNWLQPTSANNFVKMF